jgi:hypothetical protein
MSRLFLIAALLACSLLAVAATTSTDSDDLILQNDPVMSSFLEESASADLEFNTALSAELGAAIEEGAEPKSSSSGSGSKKKRSSGGGGVQRGGKPRKTAPNMRKGEADGSRLPPYDPFRINRRWQRVLDKRQAKRQAKVEEENQRERCAQMKERARKREEAEAREAAEEREEARKEAIRKKKLIGDYETPLFIESEAEVDAESDADVEAALDAEAAADAEAEAAADAEMEADALERDQDLAEMEQDVEQGFEADADIEGEGHALMETEAEAEAEAEVDAEAEADKPKKKSKRKNKSKVKKGPVSWKALVRPSAHVTYGRENYLDEEFDNKSQRAVFKRMRRGREIVRFEKGLQSTPGQAVVNGVTKMPCGKEITDTGLFAPVVMEKPGPTVAAANPFPPVWNDDNIRVIKKLPVVPTIRVVGGLDEYGDPIQ